MKIRSVTSFSKPQLWWGKGHDGAAWKWRTAAGRHERPGDEPWQKHEIYIPPGPKQSWGWMAFCTVCVLFIVLLFWFAVFFVHVEKWREIRILVIFGAVNTRDVKLVKSNRQLVRLKPVRDVVNHGIEPILFLFSPCLSLIFPMFLQRYRQIHMTSHEKVRKCIFIRELSKICLHSAWRLVT